MSEEKKRPELWTKDFYEEEDKRGIGCRISNLIVICKRVILDIYITRGKADLKKQKNLFNSLYNEAQQKKNGKTFPFTAYEVDQAWENCILDRLALTTKRWKRIIKKTNTCSDERKSNMNKKIKTFNKGIKYLSGKNIEQYVNSLIFNLGKRSVETEDEYLFADEIDALLKQYPLIMWKYKNPYKHISMYPEYAIFFSGIPAQQRPSVKKKKKGKKKKQKDDDKKNEKTETKEDDAVIHHNDDEGGEAAEDDNSDADGQEWQERGGKSRFDTEENNDVEKKTNDKQHYHFNAFLLYSCLPIIYTLITTEDGTPKQGYRRVAEWIIKLPTAKDSLFPPDAEKYNQLNVFIHKIHLIQKSYRYNVEPSRVIADMISGDGDVYFKKALNKIGTHLNLIRLQDPGLAEHLKTFNQNIFQIRRNVLEIVNRSTADGQHKNKELLTTLINNAVRAIARSISKLLRDVDEKHAQLLTHIINGMLQLNSWSHDNLSDIDNFLRQHEAIKPILMKQFREEDIREDEGIAELFKRHGGNRDALVAPQQDGKKSASSEDSTSDVVVMIESESLTN
jgi:hypothetical protein